MKKFLRTVDLARSAGLSTQAVRNYERWGFLPLAERGLQGYRLYGSQHLHALRTARTLIAGYGWEHARRIMQFVHQNALSSALAVIDARHAAIHQSRLEVEETLKVLRVISGAQPHAIEDDGSRKQAKFLYAGEVARRFGVRVSAIRFWEEQELICPIRDSSNRYRLYDEEQVRILQIVTLLRKAGYGIEAIHAVLTQLMTGTPEQAVMAAENRLKELVEESRRCLEASAVLWTYLETYQLTGQK